MTFESIWTNLSSGKMKPSEAREEISKPDKLRLIHYYAHLGEIQQEPLKDSQLQELQSIVEILQTLYNSDIDSPINDSTYDSLQELLTSMGIPRLTGSIEINDNNKVSHNFTTLRGTLDKVYYLFSDEKRTNKSRKYLDEWIKSAEDLYMKRTHQSIDLNKVKIILTPKFDGTSCILEYIQKPLWITRGDTQNNRASDVSHIMNIFNDVYATEKGVGQKFEVMMSEENKDKINELYKEHPYHNSRQIVTSTLNSKEMDFKAEYLYPVPLRIIHEKESVEQIHPILINDWPTEICTFGDRNKIKEFANSHRYVKHNGMNFRTDGVVMTILDPDIQKVLGRDNNINNFEVAYKFTEEVGYSKVKDIEFYVSEFGFVTPVLVVNDIILKGNTINHISLSNKERFDELDIHYGDTVKILYDIIPYATFDKDDPNCQRLPHQHKIEFIKTCPRCGSLLRHDVVQVQCKNEKCPSRIIGRILNYCANLRIQNIGGSTLDTLYTFGIVTSIKDLYKLRKHVYEIENLDGFGKLKTRKIINEIEAKRHLKDYEFFGSIGIEGLSIKTFQIIFSNIKYTNFINLIKTKSWPMLNAQLLSINGMGDMRASMLIKYFQNKDNTDELKKLLKEVSILQTYGSYGDKKKIVFTGCRPSSEMINFLDSKGYEASDSWSNKAILLVVPSLDYSSNKVDKAKSLGIKIITINQIYDL